MAEVFILHGCTGLFEMAELPDNKSSVLRHLSNIAFFLQFLSSEGPSSRIENILLTCIEHVSNIKNPSMCLCLWINGFQ